VIKPGRYLYSEENMKRSGICLSIVIVAMIMLMVWIIIRHLRYKESISIIRENETLNIEEYIGKNARLLCRTAQMTGVWFVAIAIEDNQNTFIDLSSAKGVYVFGEDPFSYLKEELTIYGDNLFVLEGELYYDEANECGPGYCLSIQNWDIVYPIKTVLRLPFFKRYIYYFDLK